MTGTAGYITESQIKAFEKLGKRWESMDIGMGRHSGGKPLGLDEYTIVPDDYRVNSDYHVWIGSLADPYNTEVCIDIDGYIEIDRAGDNLLVDELLFIVKCNEEVHAEQIWERLKGFK